jgi:hypothetical protein
MLDKYEELNLTNYVDGDENKMVFGNQNDVENGKIKESVSNLCENLKNPYLNLYHWVKGEIFDIESVNLALTNKDKIRDKIGKNEKNKKKT